MSGAKINGTPIVGQQLTTSVSINPAANSVAYQWNRNGTAIKGATAASYTVTAADAGTSLTVRITAKKSGYADGVATTPAVKAGAVSITRLAGEQREQTALEVSRATWPKGTSTVMLATSQDFPDALSAAAAAGKASASLLLTRASQISTEVAKEISRLAPTRIILVGGEGVLSTKVATQAAQAAPGAKVSRISGINRYATSRAAALAGGANDSIFIATGLDYPDAISAAAVANRAGTPVLLVHGTRTAVDAATVDTLRRIGVRKATIVGGTGAVTSQIEAQIKKLGISTTRLSGINRYETNDAIVRAHFPSGAPKVLLASGENYPDALTASVNAGRTDAPLLLARQSCIMPGAADFLRQGATASAVLVGGVGVLDAGVVALRRC